MVFSRLLTASSLIAIVAAIALGVSAWMAGREKTKLAETNAALQRTKTALEGSVKQAEEQTRALDDAVKNSRQYQQDQRAMAARARSLAEGIMAASSVKVAVTEFFYSQGKWPESNKALGGPAFDSYKAGALQSVTVVPGGKIRLVFRGENEKIERIWWNASQNGAGQVIWSCTTADIPDIGELTANKCMYQAP